MPKDREDNQITSYFTRVHQSKRHARSSLPGNISPSKQSEKREESRPSRQGIDTEDSRANKSNSLIGNVSVRAPKRRYSTTRDNEPIIILDTPPRRRKRKAVVSPKAGYDIDLTIPSQDPVLEIHNAALPSNASVLDPVRAPLKSMKTQLAATATTPSPRGTPARDELRDPKRTPTSLDSSITSQRQPASIFSTPDRSSPPPFVPPPQDQIQRRISSVSDPVPDDDSVPSSQSQYFGALPVLNDDDAAAEVPSSQSQWLASAPETLSSDEEDELALELPQISGLDVVPSSQSQWMSSLDTRDVDDDEMAVPSSQTQYFSQPADEKDEHVEEDSAPRSSAVLCLSSTTRQTEHGENSYLGLNKNDTISSDDLFNSSQSSIEEPHSLPDAVQEFLDMMDSNAAQAALVTGAGSGIGLETSILFAQEGANVLLVDINLAAAEKAAAIIKERYPNVKTLATKADVGKEADIKAAVDLAVKELGRLDVMFNNAGIMHPEDDNALNTEERIWDLTMTINLKGVWWGCKYAILAMRENPTDDSKGLHTGGSIINTASFVALLGAATPQLAYTASKGGVLAMTRELAMVHAREGIRLNSICPGPLKTPLLMDFLNTAEKRDRRMIHLPMGRFGEAVEVAKGALFLASDDSSYMTGTDFKVDGGLSSAYVTALGEPVLPPPASLI
ncbi:unnamed protein product [Mycena citricolor]|uniref:Short-chain dehydrogenase n=1 Tax=Mycena citricolor TaxID=2018698 RepID=A0AAD2JUJ4_9AGAR|nr:unnamed protein product [Mycena citricolor]